MMISGEQLRREAPLPPILEGLRRLIRFPRRTVRLHPRPCRFERLESRALLAVAALEHTFRTDDYSLGGSFSFQYTDSEYKKAMPSGTYSGSGQLTWTSPHEATATFAGFALGEATDEVFALGSWRNCSRHTIRDEGTFRFRINAEQKQLSVSHADSTNVRYTQYQDLLFGFCNPDENPPWSYFFEGFSSRYSGTFDPGTHLASLTYQSSNPTIGVTSAAVPIQWSNSAPVDYGITVEARNGAPQIPEDWVELEQPDEEPEQGALDARSGTLAITVQVAGAPLRAPGGNVQQAVAGFKVYWASANTPSATLEEIPVTSAAGLWGAHWNSRTVKANVRGLPEPPPWARFVKVTVAATAGNEANTGNNAAYLPLRTFTAQDSRGPVVAADQILEAPDQTVLGPLDAARYPEVAVLAYRPQTQRGGELTLHDRAGGYTYTPPQSPEIQALGAGELLEDRIELLVIEQQTYVDTAWFTISIQGVNDDPVAEMDQATAMDNRELVLTPADLLRNDYDPDRGDEVRLDAVESFSNWGAQVRLSSDGRVHYDPRPSDTIRALNTGEALVDYIYYTIADRHGGMAFGVVEVTVTGVNDPPEILPLPAVAADTRGGGPVVIPFVVRDWETPPDQWTVSYSVNSPLVDNSATELTGGGSDWQLSLMPQAGQTGRTWVQLEIRVPDGGSAKSGFMFVLGDEPDRDLDGIADEIEIWGTGDANGDSLEDRWQPHVATFPSLPQTVRWLLECDGGSALGGLSASAVPAAAGVAAGAVFSQGGIAYQLHVPVPGTRSTLKISSDGEEPANSYFQYDGPADSAGTSWNWLMWNGRDGARIWDDHVELLVQDGGRGDLDGQANGVIVGFAAAARVTNPWHNRRLALDVDNDGVIAPIDALHVINYLNSDRDSRLPALPAAGDVLSLFVDTTGDNVAAPLDALLIFNELNAPA